MVLVNKDWFEVGLEILTQFGKPGLTIERMTEVIGVTKGSFYHHFKNMREFEERLIAYWADQYLSTEGNIPESPTESLALLDAIMIETFANITQPEIAIRAWAQDDKIVREIVEKIDRVRHKFANTIFYSITGNEKQSKMMADMLFAILIGSITALPRIESERVMEMYHEFKRLYGLNIDREANGSCLVPKSL